jgi:hypothetical protein
MNEIFSQSHEQAILHLIWAVTAYAVVATIRIIAELFS